MVRLLLPFPGMSTRSEPRASQLSRPTGFFLRLGLAAVVAGAAGAGCYSWDAAPLDGESEEGSGGNKPEESTTSTTTTSVAATGVGGAGATSTTSTTTATGVSGATTSVSSTSTGVSTTPTGATTSVTTVTTGGSTIAGGLGGGTCDSCVESVVTNACALESLACGADEECAALAECVTEAAFEDCADAYPDGVDLFLAAADCAVCDNCAAQCGDLADELGCL